MPDLGNTSVFNPTDASNNSGTMPSWNGASAVNTLDNAGRGLQGAIARDYQFRNFSVTTTNTGNAYTAAYAIAPEALVDGMAYGVRFNATNSGAATLNIGVGGAKAIKTFFAGTLQDVLAGQIETTAARLIWLAASDCFLLDQAVSTPSLKPVVWATLDNATETNIAATYAVVSNVITVTKTAHGHLVGHRRKYLPSSGGLSGQNLFLVITSVTANTFSASLTAANTSGNGNMSEVPLLHAVNCHSCCLTATGRIFINYSVTAPTLNQYMYGTADDLSADSTVFSVSSSSPPTTTGWSIVAHDSSGASSLIVRFVISW